MLYLATLWIATNEITPKTIVNTPTLIISSGGSSYLDTFAPSTNDGRSVTSVTSTTTIPTKIAMYESFAAYIARFKYPGTLFFSEIF